MKHGMFIFVVVCGLLMLSGAVGANSMKTNGLGLETKLGLITAPDTAIQDLYISTPAFRYEGGEINYQITVFPLATVRNASLQYPYSELCLFIETDGMKYVIDKIDLALLSQSSKPIVRQLTISPTGTDPLSTTMQGILTSGVPKEMKVGYLVTSPVEYGDIPNIRLFNGRNGFSAFSASQAKNFNAKMPGESIFRALAQINFKRASIGRDIIIW